VIEAVLAALNAERALGSLPVALCPSFSTCVARQRTAPSPAVMIYTHFLLDAGGPLLLAWMPPGCVHSIINGLARLWQWMCSVKPGPVPALVCDWCKRIRLGPWLGRKTPPVYFSNPFVYITACPVPWHYASRTHEEHLYLIKAGKEREGVRIAIEWAFSLSCTLGRAPVARSLFCRVDTMASHYNLGVPIVSGNGSGVGSM
jgi:hypothetical protein